MKNVYVQLGRYGDILGFLPVMYDHFMRTGSPAKIMVAEEFEDLLEGVSYLDPLIFQGSRDDLATAMHYAKPYGRAVNAQAKGRGVITTKRTDSFIREPWMKIGRDERWEQVSLVLDRRDFQREEQLRNEVFASNKEGLPVLLVNHNSRSSPFSPEQMDRLTAALGALDGMFAVVDISNIKAHRIYDLLGLLDHATCLISVDTSVLHLATASSCPVVALVNDDPWHASLPLANHIYHATYSTFDTDAIIEAAFSTLPAKRNVVHVYPVWDDMSADTAARMKVASASWKLPGWVHTPVRYERTAQELGDPRRVTHLHELIDAGMAKCTADDDVVVISNTDIGFTSDISEQLCKLMNRGACFAYRFNFETIDRPLTRAETVSGEWDGGLDLFAFTRAFWREHRSEFPAVYMGCPWWDLLYRDIIKRLGGGELYGCIWHEKHPSVWKTDPKFPANLHNKALYDRYCRDHDRTRPYHQRWGVKRLRA